MIYSQYVLFVYIRIITKGESPTQSIVAPNQTPSPTITGKKCNQPNQPIRPQSGHTIVCDNNCNRCEIICDVVNQCFDTRIYSGALNTVIKCTGENSCSKSKIYVGKTGNYPMNYDHTNFERTNYNSVHIDCSKKVSCKEASIIIDGYFSSNLALNAAGNAEDSFKDSVLDVALYSTQRFNLNCGSFQANCDGSQYICRGGLCLCNQNNIASIGGCIGILNGIQDKTRNPTKSPTDKPTTFPTPQTISPTQTPTKFTESPTLPTNIPSQSPTHSPTNHPTLVPTKFPTKVTNIPTISPTKVTNNPSNNPSESPTIEPTWYPTHSPSLSTQFPSSSPTIEPTMLPTHSPNIQINSILMIVGYFKINYSIQ